MALKGFDIHDLVVPIDNRFVGIAFKVKLVPDGLDLKRFQRERLDFPFERPLLRHAHLLLCRNARHPASEYSKRCYTGNAATRF